MNSTSMQLEIAWGKFFLQKKKKKKKKGNENNDSNSLRSSCLYLTSGEQGQSAKNLTSCISVVVSFRGVESFFSQSSM